MVSRCSEGQIPGSGETSPNPVLCAMPVHPDHTSAAAGAARTSSGQDRTVLARAGIGTDHFAAAFATIPGTGPSRPGGWSRRATHQWSELLPSR